MDHDQSPKPADPSTAPAPVADEAPKEGKTKEKVAGAEGFDAQEAKLKPPADPGAGPAKAGAGAPDAPPGDKGAEPAKEAAPEKSEADKMREANAANATEWDGKEFMSQEEIEDVRVKTGLKNYTTCIDFAGKMMRESSKEVFGKDWKKAAATSSMLGKVKGDWEQAVGAKNQATGLQKSIANIDKSIASINAKKADAAAKIDTMRRAQDAGENPMVYKQRLKQADILEKQQLGAFDSVIRQQQKVRDGLQIKADAATEKATNLDAKNTAMIKAEDGMTNGRPKEGEFIILSQAPGGGSYGVSAETKVTLAGGSFKHIAIFMSVDKEDDGTGVETWKTIDGGGTKGKTTFLFVRKADRMVFPAFQGAHTPEVGSASKSQVAGWIDMAELIKMRDQKSAGGTGAGK